MLWNDPFNQICYALPPPLFKKKVHFVLHLSVGQSLTLYWPSDVCSISFDPFVWKLPYLVQWKMTPNGFQVIWWKVKVKSLVFVQILSTLYLLAPPNLIQWISLESRCSPLIFRSNGQMLVFIVLSTVLNMLWPFNFYWY